MIEKYTYSVFEERLFQPDIGEYTAYGIKITSDNPLFVSKTITDISVSKPEISSLVKRCNKCQLQPIHFEDVVDDFLCE